MHTRGGRSPNQWDKIKGTFLEELQERTGAAFSLSRVNGRWASGPRGLIGIVSGEERPEGDRWFMGLDAKALGEAQPLGVILVCEARDGRRIVLGFEASRWESLRERMSRDSKRGELKFALRRRGDRYFLEGIDVTSALDDFSWLSRSDPASSSLPGEARSVPDDSPVLRGTAHSFFARVVGRVLDPLDATELSDGDVVLVSARPAPVVPSNATLRRLIAAGGPSSLPPDFAEQHDAHAHGAPRR